MRAFVYRNRDDCRKRCCGFAFDIRAVVGLAYGAALNVLDNCLLVGFALVRRDTLLGRFLLFGVLVGFPELPADAWLVEYTRTLDYRLAAAQ
jgi:hypothetical protein